MALKVDSLHVWIDANWPKALLAPLPLQPNSNLHHNSFPDSYENKLSQLDILT